MSNPQLIEMANQIGQFFESNGDKTQAMQGAINHIKRFWAPSMRQEMDAALKSNQAQGLSEFMQEAFRVNPIKQN